MIKKYLGFHDVRGTYLINLDAEEEGVFITSCAGGVRTDLSLPTSSFAGVQRALIASDLFTGI